MLQEKKINTNIGVGLGLIIQVSYVYLRREGYLPEPFATVIELLGLFTFAWGCMNYAEGKGHSKWLGLLGLLCCIGLGVLVLLPDHHKETK